MVKRRVSFPKEHVLLGTCGRCQHPEHATVCVRVIQGHAPSGESARVCGCTVRPLPAVCPRPMGDFGQRS
jgi:hypothetical protein